MYKFSNGGHAHLVIIVSVLVFLNSFVIVASSSSKKCATMYNSQSYKGRPYSMKDGDKEPSLRSMNFLPSSVQVSSGCFLTVFDVYGYNQTLEKDAATFGWNNYRILDAACCECNGCSGAANNLGNLCARLYENPRCDGCSGYRLDLNPGDVAKNFGMLNNRMASVAVRQGCVLAVFSETGFGGWRFNFTESTNMLGNNWFKQISSAKCGCDDNWPPPETFTNPSMSGNLIIAPITLPTVPPTKWTRPPITLPTVPTTRAPITLPTVPTTRAPITLPTLPTTTRAPVTLPTKPTTTTTEEYSYELPPSESEEEDTSEDDTNGADSSFDYNFFGSNKSPEIFEPTTTKTTTTTTTTTTTPPPTTTSKSTVWGFADEDEEENDKESEEEEEKESEEEDEWGTGDW